MAKIRFLTVAAMLVTALPLVVSAVASGASPAPLRRVWEHRFRFEGDLPLRPGEWLAVAHCTAEVKSHPAALVLEDGTNRILRIEAPDEITPPYRLHLALAGRGPVSVLVEREGKIEYHSSRVWPRGFDPLLKEWRGRLRWRTEGGASDFCSAISPGGGQADVRFVTEGRENRPYRRDGRLFFTFSARLSHALGVMSLDPDRLDFRFEGVILFDYGDGRLRNDVACDLFHDVEAGEWRAYVCNFSTGGETLGGRAPGGVNVAWSRDCPLFGVSVMAAKSLGLPGMNEDPDGFWDAAAGKWRLFVSEFGTGIRASLWEADAWDGPFRRLAGPVKEDSTGTTLAWVGGRLRALAGSSERAFYAYDYPTLENPERLALDSPPWVSPDGAELGWAAGRVWPAYVELGSGRRLLLTFDRTNEPGMPLPNWTYGKLILYRADDERP